MYINRLETVSENLVKVVKYAYDENGNRQKTTYGSGSGVAGTEYEYNDANFVKSLTNLSYGGDLSSYTYDYYLNGNQHTKSESISGTTTTYTYDYAGRLSEEHEEKPGGVTLTKGYDYDRAGNRANLYLNGSNQPSTTYAYDKNNRLLTEVTVKGENIQTASYVYDNNGNNLSKITETLKPKGDSQGAPLETLNLIGFDDSGAGEDYSFELNEYDAFNRLTKTFTNGFEAEYDYLANGYRNSKVVNGVKTSHVWDGGNIVADYGVGVGNGGNNGNGGVNKYIYGIGLIANVSANSPSDKQYYMFNAHGDVVHMLNNSGVAVKSYEYDAFGVEQNIDPDDENPFR